MLQGLIARSVQPGGGGGGGEVLAALITGMQAQQTELLRSMLNRPDTSSTLLQVLERGMAIAAETRLDAEGGWMAQVARIAKDVLPALSEAMKARAMMPPAMPMPPGSPALPPGAPPSSSSNPPSSTRPPNGSPATAGALDIDQLVREFTPSILEAIGNNAAAEDVADTILNFIPAFYYPQLESLDAERAIRAAPALSQHRPYVQTLMASIREQIGSGGDDDGGGEAA